MHCGVSAFVAEWLGALRRVCIGGGMVGCIASCLQWWRNGWVHCIVSSVVAEWLGALHRVFSGGGMVGCIAACLKWWRNGWVHCDLPERRATPAAYTASPNTAGNLQRATPVAQVITILITQTIWSSHNQTVV